MGSSKKHKEKKEKKKHKKRSRSGEREHKRSHKKSHKKDKKKSPERETIDIDRDLELSKEPDRQFAVESSCFQESPLPSSSQVVQASPVQNREPSPVEDDFDIDKLLDSKLSEKIDVPPERRAKKRRIREDVLEEFKKRQHLGKFKDAEEHSKLQSPSNYARSPPKSPSREIPFITDVKQEPPEVQEFIEEPVEPKLSLSIDATNKLRAKLGLRPLDVCKKEPEEIEPKSSSSVNENNKLRAKIGLRPLDVENEPPESSEPQLSLSVNETNKLRAKLGLKPLEVGGDIPGITSENGDASKAAEVFVKTENISEIKRTEALRERLKVHKEKRAIEEKLRKTKTVADSDSEEESAANWVLKHQRLVQEKEQAEKRAKLLEEMDKEFGVSDLVEEEFKKHQSYTSRDLKGLTIGHDVQTFKEGTPVILTLKDKGVLEEEEDVLENVNIVDSEKYSKNVENKKKKPSYQPYEEPEYDEFGILKKKNLLSKYDEEIEGEKKKTFKIGEDVVKPSHSTREGELELIRMKLKQQSKVSLEMPDMKPANEYYTPDDMVQFKKPKKKKKIRKLKADDLLLKADDLLSGSYEEENKDLGSRKKRKVVDDVPYSSDLHEVEAPEIMEDLSNVVIDQPETDVYSALNKAKRLKERKVQNSAPEKVIEILSKATYGTSNQVSSAKVTNIELNSVAEFCRTLGDIPTYGQSGNREDGSEEMMDIESELMDEQQEGEAQNRGAWNEVDIDERPVDISVRENEPILEEEPDINTGVAGALKLAMKKGYLDKESKKNLGASKSSLLQAKSYTIEEKFYEDDKFGKRDRYTGPTQEFKDKPNYKPDVKLEYIDDSGRLLTAKEAFRYLSHKFHGKGPGKNKVDKRMKKLDQDTRLKQMSSTDTPLNTVKLLQAKQKETQSPYIVLSGGNKTLTQTMISKSKV